MQRRTRKKQKQRTRILLYCFLFILFIAMCAVIAIKKISSAPSFSVGLKNLNSACVLLLDYESGETLAAKQEETQIFPASLTKIMTALIAIEELPDRSRLLNVPASIYQPLYHANASMAGFEPGDEVSVTDLLYGTLLPSGAECCLTLADYIAGSEESFVAMMNEKAQTLGMKNTSFCNSTGLHDPSHYTTLRDISLLLKYALENEVFYSIFTSMTYTSSPVFSHPKGLIMENTLRKYPYPLTINGGEFLGGKTGFTNEAGQCLASLAKINEKRYLLITVQAKGSPSGRQLHIEDALSIYTKIAKGLPLAKIKTF